MLDAVRYWQSLHKGERPPFVGRIRVHRVNEMPIIYAFRGSIYIGPVPAAEVMAWPGCELWNLGDLFTVWVRDGGQWMPQLNIELFDLDELQDRYGSDYETWPSVFEIQG